MFVYKFDGTDFTQIDFTPNTAFPGLPFPDHANILVSNGFIYICTTTPGPGLLVYNLIGVSQDMTLTGLATFK